MRTRHEIPAEHKLPASCPRRALLFRPSLGNNSCAENSRKGLPMDGKKRRTRNMAALSALVLLAGVATVSGQVFSTTQTSIPGGRDGELTCSKLASSSSSLVQLLESSPATCGCAAAAAAPLPFGASPR